MLAMLAFLLFTDDIFFHAARQIIARYYAAQRAVFFLCAHAPCARFCCFSLLCCFTLHIAGGSAAMRAHYGRKRLKKNICHAFAIDVYLRH